MPASGANSGARTARPRRSGFSAGAASLFSTPFLSQTASAEELFGARAWDVFAAAISAIDRHDLAALSLTLGILGSAVVTAILLVRTRSRASEAAAKFRDERMALKAEVDRVHALLLSEPQIVVSWAAAADEPE